MQAFLAPLLAIFGEPATPEPERTLAEFGRHLRGYSVNELSTAADFLARTHKGPARWPKLADCIEACNDARERMQVQRKPTDVVGESWRQRANAAERAMIESEMGQEAARDGWANGLRDFLMAKRRFPYEHEIHEIKRTAHFVDRCAAGTVDMGLLHKSLLVLVGKFAARRDAVAERVRNGELLDPEIGGGK
jgi:hypothetical protein